MNTIRLQNPILNRELLTLLRSTKAFTTLGVFLLGSSVTILAIWPRESFNLLVQGQISREFFAMFSLMQMIILGLLVPAIMAPSMTVEKERETLDLLLTTPLSGHAILFGKLASGLVYFLLVVFASIPVLMVCFLIGGISSDHILGLYICLFTQTFLYGLISLNCSVFSNRTYIALILSYIFSAMVGGLTIVIYADGLNFISERLVIMLFVAVPLIVLLYCTAHSRIREPFSNVRKSMDQEDVTQQSGLIIRRDRWPDKWLIPPRSNKPIKDGVNPVLVKETQTEIYGSGSLFVRLLIQFGMILGLIAYLITMGTFGSTLTEGYMAGYPFICYLLGYVILVAPSIAAASFSREREEQTMESLYLTLIPRWKIIIGKFLPPVRIIGILTLLNGICFPLLFILNIKLALIIPLSVVSALLFSVSLAMTFSFFSRTTFAATLRTYVLLAVLFFLPPVIKNFWSVFQHTDLSYLDVVSPFLACYGADKNPFKMQLLVYHGMIYTGLAAFLLVILSIRFEKSLKKQWEKI